MEWSELSSYGPVVVSLVVVARLAHALRHGLSSLPPSMTTRQIEYLPLITKRGSACAAHTFFALS